MSSLLETAIRVSGHGSPSVRKPKSSLAADADWGGNCPLAPKFAKVKCLLLLVLLAM